MRYFTTLLLTVLVFSVFAQNDLKVKEILDKAATKFKNYPSVEIDFTFSMENKAEGINEVQEGKVWMKNNMYKLNMMGAENYYDGQTIYTYMPEVQEVNVKDPTEEEEGFLNPAALFDIHNQGFHQKMISHTAGVAYIELTPIEEKKFKKIGIWINTSKSNIQKVTYFEKGGNKIVVKMNSIKAIDPIPADSFFTFDTAKHPDVDVIDMR